MAENALLLNAASNRGYARDQAIRVSPHFPHKIASSPRSPVVVPSKTVSETVGRPIRDPRFRD